MEIGDWPEVHPDVRTLADAEMLLAGAFAPKTSFGGRLPLPDDLAALARAHGGVVLVDEEGAPVAGVAQDGGLVALAHPESGAFRRLRRPPQRVRDEGTHVGLLLDRPLLADEVTALRDVGERQSVLLLVRTIDPQIPPDVLVKCTLAAARHISGAQVVTLPFARRDEADDDAVLTEVVLANYGATPVDVRAPDEQWRSAQRALDSDDVVALAELVDPDTLRVLRRWRPPRASRGVVVFFTGLSGSGKSTVARALVDRLHETERAVTVLDGDVARRMLSSGLGFSRQDRDTNIRRLGWVGAEVARHGGVAVLAPIAPFAATRAEVRRMVEAVGDLVLVWVATPLEECERRDRKGLYAKARRGEVADFTGISSPYEQPDDADVVIDTTDVSVDDAAGMVWEHLVRGGWVPAARTTGTAG